MIIKQTRIINKSGLHASPASELVKTAKKYNSKITIRKMEKDGEEVNAKSIVRLLAEGIGQGTKVELAVDGEDEQAAAEELIALIECGFLSNEKESKLLADEKYQEKIAWSIYAGIQNYFTTK